MHCTVVSGLDRHGDVDVVNREDTVKPAGGKSAAKLDRSWWETECGREARRWLSTWGEVQQLRLATGDPSAVPSFAGASGCGRGTPGDASSALLIAAEVEAFLQRYVTPRQRALAEFVFRDGSCDVMTTVVYVFPDGTRSDPMPWGAPPPPNFATAEAGTKRAFDYDLMLFPAPEVDTVCEMFQYDRRGFLERELVRVGKRLAQVKGL